MRLLQALYKLVKEQKDYEILTVDERNYTYSDIQQSMDRWKVVLERCNIKKRDKVVVYIKELIDFVGLYFALCELDCILIPVDSSSKPDIIGSIIESSNAHAVISSQELALQDIKETIRISLGYTCYCTKNEAHDVDEDIMQMLYTSGTTGLPKCVMYSKENMANNILVLARKLGLSKQDVIYTPVSCMLPAALNTVLLPAIISCTRIVVSKSTMTGKVLRNIIEQKVTVFFAVPFYYKLLKESELCTQDTWKDVRLCLTSSAYLSEETFMEFYQKSGQGLHSIYCSSEAGTIAYNDAADIKSLRKYVGKPLTGCEISIADKNEQGEGEIIVKGGMISSKYYQNEELNQKVFAGEWIKTGDFGSVNKEGYLEIKGRLTETINIAGHLVNPLEVEQVIMKQEMVEDAVAYKYRNHAGNDMLGVKVVIKSGYSVEERDIMKCCEAVLPNYKVPKKVLFVDTIATGRYGKKKRSV